MSMGLSLVIRTHHECRVWSPVPITPLIAFVGDHVVGLYSPVGWGVRAWVIGYPPVYWDNSDPDCVLEDHWRETCNMIAGSAAHWVARYTDLTIQLAMPNTEYDHELFNRLCPTARWDNKARAWIVGIGSIDYVKFVMGR